MQETFRPSYMQPEKTIFLHIDTGPEIIEILALYTWANKVPFILANCGSSTSYGSKNC